jgi:hypothetical protein
MAGVARGEGAVDQGQRSLGIDGEPLHQGALQAAAEAEPRIIASRHNLRLCEALTVLLQSFIEGKDGAVSAYSQAAMPNREFTKVAWATIASPAIPFTCPFLIIAKVSYPTRVRHAVRDLLNPRPDLTSLFIRL